MDGGRLSASLSFPKIHQLVLGFYFACTTSEFGSFVRPRQKYNFYSFIFVFRFDRCCAVIQELKVKKKLRKIDIRKENVNKDKRICISPPKTFIVIFWLVVGQAVACLLYWWCCCFHRFYQKYRFVVAKGWFKTTITNVFFFS